MNTLIRLLILVLVVSVAIWLVNLIPIGGIIHLILIAIVVLFALGALMEGYNGFSWRGPRG